MTNSRSVSRRRPGIHTPASPPYLRRMQAFAELLDRLVLTPSRNGKLRLIVSYFRAAPDPDRGYALGALTGDLDLKSIKPAAIRELVTDRMDAELFRLSYDYVGDMAETVSLVWPGERRANGSTVLFDTYGPSGDCSRATGRGGFPTELPRLTLA